MPTYGAATTALAKLASSGHEFTLDAASLAVFGRPATQDERNRLSGTLWKLARSGELVKVGRGRYRSAVVPPPPIDNLGIVTPRPTGPAAVRHEINRLALVVNEFHAIVGELLSDLHRANGCQGAVPDAGDRPAGFPIRLYSSTSTVTVRRRGP